MCVYNKKKFRVCNVRTQTNLVLILYWFLISRELQTWINRPPYHREIQHFSFFQKFSQLKFE